MKRIVLTVLIACAVTPVFAAEVPKRTQHVGVGSGAVIGALAGGPVGAIIGAAIGGHYADSVGRAGQVDGLETELATTRAANEESSSRIASLNRSLFETRSELEKLGTEMGELLLERAVFEGLQMEVMYPTGTAELGAEATARVQQLAGLLARIPEMTVRLDGFADPRGDESYNLGLSRARAEAVRDELVAAGTDAQRISIHAHGEASPETGDLDAYALERRVRIRLFASPDATRIAQHD